jgi:6-pyruvoyltetrahydropterin/6-carboxytetrahydropterin synthase
MIYLTRRERFNAAHRLYRPEWSDEKNQEVFGGCSNPNWHGHNYELFVTVRGVEDPETGFVVNLKALSGLIRDRIISKVDHKNLNLDVDFMKGKMTSTEELAKSIWHELLHPVSELGAELHCVRLNETENNYVEYFG